MSSVLKRLFVATLVLLLSGWFHVFAPAAAQNGAVDVAIWTHENGGPAYDACYVLVGYSDVGCDENRDGKVLFSAIPYGTYTVRQTADLGANRFVDDFTIDVTGPGGNSANWQSFSATIVHRSNASSGQTSNVAIVTTENGEPVTDVCYVLVDFSNEGCDKNADGKITFKDVPFGTYTVRQTADLGSGRSVADFTISVTGTNISNGWERFGASVTSGTSSGSISSTQARSSGPIDIALITRDPSDGHLLTGACYELVRYSLEGCDENGDGQVTFAAIPPGVYTVHQTRTPAGYPTINDYDIDVEPLRGPEGTFAIPLGFIVKQAVVQNAPNTRNVSVVFVDSRTFTRVTSPICVRFVNVSEEGCDEDLIDGQVDFIDLPVGNHELAFSNLPDQWQIMGDDRTGLTITIGATPGQLPDQIVYIGVYVPDSADAQSGEIVNASSPDSSGVVGDDGIALELDGVSISGAPDVAPKGTSVQAHLATEDLPGEVQGFASAAGAGVEITLGNGIQPASPLTITFAPDVVSGWGASPDSAGDLLPVVFASKEDGSGVELADAQVLPDGSVVVTADHLSWFQPALISISGFTSWLGEQTAVFLQLRSDKPGCVDTSLEDEVWQISSIPHQLIWPCVEHAGNDVEVRLTNNSPEVWLVSSDQATPGYPIVLSPVGLLFAGIVLQGIDKATTSPLIPPDGAVTFSASGAEDQIVLNAEISAPLTVINSAVKALLIFVNGRMLDNLAEADCFLDIVATAIDTSAIPDDAAYTEFDAGSFTSTIAGCFGTALGLLGQALGGAVFSAVADAPGAFAANIEGAYLTATGADSFSIILTKKEHNAGDQQTGSSPAASWPTDRDDGPGRLYVWLGASAAFGGPDYPDWVACDDAGAYCLLGYDDGSSPVLVEMSGLNVIGELDYSAADPRQELLAFGLSDDVVTQILGE